MRFQRLHLRLAAVAAASGTVTLLVASVPSLRFAYHRPALHVAFETAAVLVVALAAFLVYGRFQRSHKLPDLLLACGLFAIATSNFAYGAIPAAFAGLGAHPSLTWAALAGRMFGTLLIAVSAFAPARALQRGRLAFASVAGVVVGAGLICSL